MNLINEELDMTKNELKKFIKDICEKEFDNQQKKIKVLTKDEVKEIIRTTLENQYKIFWNKRSFWSKDI